MPLISISSDVQIPATLDVKNFTSRTSLVSTFGVGFEKFKVPLIELVFRVKSLFFL